MAWRFFFWQNAKALFGCRSLKGPYLSSRVLGMKNLFEYLFVFNFRFEPKKKHSGNTQFQKKKNLRIKELKGETNRIPKKKEFENQRTQRLYQSFFESGVLYFSCDFTLSAERFT